MYVCTPYIYYTILYMNVCMYCTVSETHAHIPVLCSGGMFSMCVLFEQISFLNRAHTYSEQVSCCFEGYVKSLKN